MGELKVGDKVRIPKYNAYGVITDIDHNWIFPYEVRIEIINDANVSKHDIDELYDERDLQLVIQIDKKDTVSKNDFPIEKLSVQQEIEKLIERIKSDEFSIIKTGQSANAIIRLTEARMWIDEHYKIMNKRSGKSE